MSRDLRIFFSSFLATLIIGEMSAFSAALIIFWLFSMVLGPCSKSIITKSKPAYPAISAIAGSVNFKNVPIKGPGWVRILLLKLIISHRL